MLSAFEILFPKLETDQGLRRAVPDPQVHRLVRQQKKSVRILPGLLCQASMEPVVNPALV